MTMVPSPPLARLLTDLAVLGVLLLALHLDLLSALISALATYSIYTSLLRAFSPRMKAGHASTAALGLTVAALVLIAAVLGVTAERLWSHRGLPELLNILADEFERLKSLLPPWLSERLPASIDDLQQVAARWLRANAQDVQRWGQDALRAIAHVLVGLVIGLLAAVQRSPQSIPPWMQEVGLCWRNLVRSFVGIVSAQVRIAGVNTLFTGIFLLVALPLFGIRVPLAWTLVLVTFFAGFIPIVGNLASNGAILLVALTVSPGVALASLIFLLAIHKLEYFLNAHFVGIRTSVPAPILLASMLLLEAAFGMAGLVAAPIYCAWVFLQFGGTSSAQAPAPD